MRQRTHEVEDSIRKEKEKEGKCNKRPWEAVFPGNSKVYFGEVNRGLIEGSWRGPLLGA